MKTQIFNIITKASACLIVSLICTSAWADLNTDMISVCNNNPGCKKAVQNTDAAKYAAACASVTTCLNHPTYIKYMAANRVVVQELASLSSGKEIADPDCNDPAMSNTPVCKLQD